MTKDSTSTKLWFKRKKYGWGWTPSTWQGWLSIAVYIFLLCLYPLSVTDEKSFSVGVFSIIAIVLTAGLFVLCYIKGEKPAWSWGDDKAKK